ncbi:Uncharacterized protein APZ42_019756 [Daphnia magna]|uniref:Uncharacterized protein n=1 Tax=Daphnia magna TaxID=35525 RepID=A0A164XPL2_9CRUS|nr:Uncharacterized protein APZ42_019756 [Daphnia magna]
MPDRSKFGEPRKTCAACRHRNTIRSRTTGFSSNFLLNITNGKISSVMVNLAYG